MHLLVGHLKSIILPTRNTGEGHLDEQTIHGKTPVGVAKIAQQRNIPVVAIAGGIEGNPIELYQKGITAMIDITPKPMSLNRVMERTIPLLEQASERVARLILIGGSLLKD